MIESFASGFLVFAYFATALFQLAIALGAPLGEYAYGGQREGKLPTPYRVASGISFLVMIAISGHYLAQTGILTPLLSAQQNAIVNWVLVGFASLAALMNNITKSQKEKRLWGSTTLAMLLSAVLVAL
ncbi:hypothetical protein [Aquiluna sp. KACHI24]|uniref:hypothetical protein n=1 Tax=Aquiluna sp. KACHI24 TaxID=2968831 RepID=UPI002204FD8A|nr:hypothetical protein [Aquiluna sp. KACHI24]BDP99996.1 hypothetical protein AKACHI_03330 [Aquiluna sp. KACHI24]